MKGIARAGLIAGVVVALLVGAISPTAHTFKYIGLCLALLAVIAGLLPLSSRAKFLSRRISAELVLLIVAVTVSLVLAEIGLRLFAFQYFPEPPKESLAYQYDPVLGWFPVPNRRSSFTANRTFTIQNNSKGFRGPEHLITGKPRVMFLGDSFVWGYDVEASDRFTEKLQARHAEWNVYNFGVSGYSTDQEYLLLQRYFQEYRPDLVVLIFCTENDDADNCANFRGPYFKPYYTVASDAIKLNGVPVPRSERVFSVTHPILSRSFLMRLAVRAYKNQANPSGKYNPSPTFAILKDMQAYLKERGSFLVVALTAGEPHLQSFLERSHIPHLDLSTSLRFAEGDHWTPQGHDFVCSKIEGFLEAGNYLSSQGSKPNVRSAPTP